MVGWEKKVCQAPSRQVDSARGNWAGAEGAGHADDAGELAVSDADEVLDDPSADGGASTEVDEEEEGEEPDGFEWLSNSATAVV